MMFVNYDVLYIGLNRLLGLGLRTYLDDLIITGTDNGLITKLQVVLHATFRMKDLGQLTYFLGLEVHHRSNDIFLNQHKYI